jgi:cbb3-type cytochrome oxidase maturation protein
VSFLFVTIPVSLLVAVALLALVVHAVRTGVFDDWEGPSARLHYDTDAIPELPEGEASASQPSASPPEGGA